MRKTSRNFIYIGQFGVRLDEAKDEVEDLMLIRSDDVTKKKFHDTTRLLKKHNVVFALLMHTTGDSYLAGHCLMKIQESSNQENTALIPKKAKSKDTEQLASYFRFTTTLLDLEASTVKEAISKQNYATDECFINSIYDFYHDNLLKADKKRNVITRASILQIIGKRRTSSKACPSRASLRSSSSTASHSMSSTSSARSCSSTTHQPETIITMSCSV